MSPPAGKNGALSSNGFPVGFVHPKPAHAVSTRNANSISGFEPDAVELRPTSKLAENGSSAARTVLDGTTTVSAAAKRTATRRRRRPNESVAACKLEDVT